MIDTERFVLPFKWREFGKWFSTLGVVKEKNNAQIKIDDIFFEASERKLDGIRIVSRFCYDGKRSSDVFLLSFLADMKSMELFEPFIGSPDCFASIGLSGKFLHARPGQEEHVELFIPDQGWILPSLWRFLVESLGLKKKEKARMPEILVLAFQSASTARLLTYATKPFDYFGNANRLKEEIALRQFFSMLNIDEAAPEAEVQRAYLTTCREFQAISTEGLPFEIKRKKSSEFAKIKNGYQVWIENLQKQGRG